jgi:hypothetical protein
LIRVTLSKLQVKRETKIYHRRLPSGNTTFRSNLGTINRRRRANDFKTDSEAQKFAANSNAESHKRHMGVPQDLATVRSVAPIAFSPSS